MVAINNISDCKRVVIKIGSSLVTNNSNDIDKKFLDSISSDIQNLHKQNKEVILVSSGAVALGNRDKNKRFHLTLLAENTKGYWNLVEIASKAYTEGYYYKPRVDYDLLKQHSEGIIALSGCLGGEIAQ